MYSYAAGATLMVDKHLVDWNSGPKKLKSPEFETMIARIINFGLKAFDLKTNPWAGKVSLKIRTDQFLAIWANFKIGQNGHAYNKWQ